MANIEELPTKPFLKRLGEMGLPTRIREGKSDKELNF